MNLTRRTKLNYFNHKKIKCVKSKTIRIYLPECIRLSRWQSERRSKNWSYFAFLSCKNDEKKIVAEKFLFIFFWEKIVAKELVDIISLKRKISFHEVNNVGIWGHVSNVVVSCLSKDNQLLRKKNCLTIFIQSRSDPAMNMLMNTIRELLRWHSL